MPAAAEQRWQLGRQNDRDDYYITSITALAVLFHPNVRQRGRNGRRRRWRMKKKKKRNCSDDCEMSRVICRPHHWGLPPFILLFLSNLLSIDSLRLAISADLSRQQRTIVVVVRSFSFVCWSFSLCLFHQSRLLSLCLRKIRRRSPTYTHTTNKIAK